MILFIILGATTFSQILSFSGATEGIAYQMPAFYNGAKYLVSYAAFRDHCSFFPASGTVRDKVGDELRGYFSGKGTIQFMHDAPLPDDLIERIVAMLERLQTVPLGGGPEYFQQKQPSGKAQTRTDSIPPATAMLFHL